MEDEEVKVKVEGRKGCVNERERRRWREGQDGWFLWLRAELCFCFVFSNFTQKSPRFVVGCKSWEKEKSPAPSPRCLREEREQVGRDLAEKKMEGKEEETEGKKWREKVLD